MCVCVCIYRESHFAIQQKLILQINYISMKIIKTEKKCKKKDGVVWSLLTDVLERENTKPWWPITTLWGKKWSRILFCRCLVLVKKNFKGRVLMWLFLLYSVVHSCPTLCNPMDSSTTGFPDLHQSPGACSNSRPLSQWFHPTILSSVVPFSCLQSFPASGSFPMKCSSHQVAKVLEFQLQHQSFQWIFRTDFL